MNEKEMQDDTQYRRDHLQRHIPNEFVRRIDDLADKIKFNMLQKKVDEANELLYEGVEMIRNEIEDPYSRSILAAYLIECTNYGFTLKGVEKAYDLFVSSWDALVKEGDAILLDSWSFWCNHIVMRRSFYMH